MKNIIKILILFFIFIHSNCFAQWIQTTGPYGTSVNTFYCDGNNTWLGTDTGIYLSSNNGVSWISRSNGTLINGLSVNSILVNNGIIFAALSSYGIYRSSDAGISWYPFNNGIQDHSNIFSLQKINNFILCGGYFQGEYLSSDNGNNWIMTNGGPNYTKTMLVSNNEIFAGGSNAVCKSTDNGFNWIPGNGIVNTVYGLAAIGTNLFASTTNIIYMSSDDGSNWISRYSNYSTVYCLTSLNNNLYIGTYFYGVKRSTDLGLTWNAINSGIYGTTTFALASNGNNIFSGFNGKGGVFFSSDQGNSWTPRNTNLPNTKINDLCINGNYMFAATDFVGIHVSTNNGDSWSILYPALPANTYNAVAATGNYVFAASIANQNYIYRSTNYGVNWSQSSSVYCNTLAINENTNTVFAGLYNSILRSTDFGVSWLTSNSTGTIYSFAFSGNSSFAGNNGQVLYSSDNGSNWSAVLTGSYGSIKGLAFTNNILFAGSSLGGILKSTDMGITWILCNNGLASTHISHIAVWDQYVFAISDNIYFSSNYGSNWSIVSYGLAGQNLIRLAINPPYIFIGTNGESVWRRPLGEIVGMNHKPENIPNSFNLYQNYPNPFNPTTKIKFDIPEVRGQTTEVRLDIYNILGQEVATLVNEKLSPGTYEVEFDGSIYPSGVYFYKLTISDPETSSGLYFSETKKLILLK